MIDLILILGFNLTAAIVVQMPVMIIVFLLLWQTFTSNTSTLIKSSTSNVLFLLFERSPFTAEGGNKHHKHNKNYSNRQIVFFSFSHPVCSNFNWSFCLKLTRIQIEFYFNIDHEGDNSCHMDKRDFLIPFGKFLWENKSKSTQS